jgi:glyoxylase-like metal-dependent hydrolase (beta-lactamase superfamily II)
MPQDDPIDLGHGVWWVGMRLPNDRFQSHAYYLHHPAGGVLFDPGSPVTIEATMAKVARIADPQSIRWLVCHHPDPDIASALPWLSEVLQSDQVKVVTEWRAAALIKFYGFRFDTWLVEEHGWQLPLAEDRVVEFQLTPYLHFPGAFVSYDCTSGILFSSDLFGGFVPDSAVLISDDLPSILQAARPFHQHYMPSSELLAAGLKRIQRRWPRIDCIAPHHGHIIASGAVAGAFEGLSRLECGVFSIGDAVGRLRRVPRKERAGSRCRATRRPSCCCKPAKGGRWIPICWICSRRGRPPSARCSTAGSSGVRRRINCASCGTRPTPIPSPACSTGGLWSRRCRWAATG